ncbi:MAG: GWxTD domain-containing protein [Melioribacter sp.]|nr:GWxTD domain-containing protein [Melioribacter sp.]
MKKLLVSIILFCNYVFGQVESSSNISYTTTKKFFVDFASYIDSNRSKTRLDIFIQVPYSSIQFIKQNDSFKASYNLSLIFYDKEKKNILLEKIWKERVSTDNFQHTLSKDNFNLSYKTFDFTPGEYLLTCIFEDADSRNSSSIDFPIKVNQISDTLGISDIIFVSDIVKDASGEKIVPNVSKTVSNKTKSLQFYFEIYSNKERNVNLEYTIEDLKNKLTYKQTTPYVIKSGINPVYYTFDNTDFKLGDYKLIIKLESTENNTLLSTEKNIYSVITGLPASIVDLDKAIEQMIYIASPNEIDFIKEGKTYDEKLNRFLAFWDKHKPNPKMDENPIMNEYYRRVEYANKNFKGWGREGWRSDMGMIYITFGPPSYVERHPLEPNSRPYEIWDYYEINRTFIFVDQTGFGDYRLINPDYSRWPGYRP